MNKKNYSTLTKLLLSILFLSGNILGQSQEDEVRKTMNGWKKAVESQNIDAIIKYYSDNFTSMDGDGKEGVRIMWSEIKELGYLDKLEITLEGAKINIENGIAEVLIFSEEGEQEMDFTLEKNDFEKWLITGIPSELCSYETYKTEYGDDCIKHNGYFRCWDIFVPEEFEKEVPLLIDILGWGENPGHQRSISGFKSLAKKEGFYVAWPYGLCNSWNSGELCCPPASEDKIDDVGFIRKMIEKVSEKFNIDKKRIYVTGLSNGCSMTQLLADEASDIITAVACMSLHLLVPKAEDYNPISVMTLLGTEDDLYNPGEEGMPGALQNFENWKNMNNCSGQYEVTWSFGNSVAWTYKECENNTEVTLVTIDGGGHILYRGEDTEINTTLLAWDFLKKFIKQSNSKK